MKQNCAHDFISFTSFNFESFYNIFTHILVVDDISRLSFGLNEATDFDNYAGSASAQLDSTEHLVAGITKFLYKL